MSWFDVAWTLSKARIRSSIRASVSCSPLTDVPIASSFSSFNKIASSFASKFADRLVLLGNYRLPRGWKSSRK